MPKKESAISFGSAFLGMGSNLGWRTQELGPVGGLPGAEEEKKK
jgi:hypothetical protein